MLNQTWRFVNKSERVLQMFGRNKKTYRALWRESHNVWKVGFCSQSEILEKYRTFFLDFNCNFLYFSPKFCCPHPPLRKKHSLAMVLFLESLTMLEELQRILNKAGAVLKEHRQSRHGYTRRVRKAFTYYCRKWLHQSTRKGFSSFSRILRKMYIY